MLSSHCLHLVFAEIFVVQILQETLQLLVVNSLFGGSLIPRGNQHRIFDKDRTIDAQSQGKSIARPRVDGDQLAFTFNPDHGIERVVFNICNDDLLNVSLQAEEYAFDQVVGHWTGRDHLFDFELDGVGFVDSDPNWKDIAAGGFLEDHNGHVGDGIHHQASDFHFDFHGNPPLTSLSNVYTAATK